MTKPTDIAEPHGLPGFWQRVREANDRFLGLDYDGTLAPFEVDPLQAKPLPGISALLRKLAVAGQTQIAIISGRPAIEVMTLLDNPPVTVVGSHGYEFRSAGGTCLIRQPSLEQQRGLSDIAISLQKQGHSHKMEGKVASIAFHTRGLDSQSADAIEKKILTEWSGKALDYGLECRCFNGGVEFRCLGWNKGNALKTLLDLQPENAFAVYIGDDDTDEDAFAVLHDRGIGIKVGDPRQPTSAHGFLPDCRAVAVFLQTWFAITESRGGR